MVVALLAVAAVVAAVVALMVVTLVTASGPGRWYLQGGGGRRGDFCST